MTKIFKATSDDPSFTIFIFRLLVFSSLVITAVLFGTLTYMFLDGAEYRSYRDQYSSIANQIDGFAQIAIRNAKTTSEQLAFTYGLTFNTADQWPNASIPGFQEIGNKLQSLLQIQYAYTYPIVYPETLAGFEAYAKKAYEEDPDIPPEAGYIPGYGFGVYQISFETLERTPDRTGGEIPFSKYKLLTPILNGYPADDPASFFMLNVHSVAAIAAEMDRVLDCVNGTPPSQRNSSICAVMTPFVRFRSTDGAFQPLSFLYFPVFPHFSPETQVGFVSVGYVWQTILLNSLPDYVRGIDCVLCSRDLCYTYTITNGQPVFQGDGDLHDREYDDMMRLVKISLGENTAPGSTESFLFIYPSDEFYSIYRTNFPLYCALGAVALILLTSGIFLGYDFFVKADARATRAVLESKRKFVRYISHEIRTPLNTVSLGLRVLDEQLNKMDHELEEEHHTAEAENKEQEGQYPGREGRDKKTELVKEKLVTELRLLTEEIREGAETAVMVVNDFLQFDKVENSTLTVDLTLCEPVEFLRKSANIFELQSATSDVSLNFLSFGLHTCEEEDEEEGEGGLEGGPPELKVLVDKIRLAQVIRNLVTNALKYSPPGSEVFVTCSRKTDGLPEYQVRSSEYEEYVSAGSFILVVEDAGPGLSRENQRKLFEDGIKFDADELQRGQLSGLGLWISKAIVELHGGKIWTDSEGVKRGTKFFVELPLLKVRRVPVQRQDPLKHRLGLYQMSEKVAPLIMQSSATLVEPQQGEDSSVGRADCKKILIVDDAPSNRKMLARLLRLRGYECETVEDGLDCVHLMQTEKENNRGSCSYDCIFLDYQMIHLNGPETAQKVRKMGFGSDKVKIIGVTGNVMREDMDLFMKMGADRVMQKPFCLETFEREWNYAKIN